MGVVYKQMTKVALWDPELCRVLSMEMVWGPSPVFSLTHFKPIVIGNGQCFFNEGTRCLVCARKQETADD